jgi:hypothetical protein
MITMNDIIDFTLAKEEIIENVHKARQKFSVAQRDNLRNRHINIQFDCLLRGYIGEYIISKWFAENNVLIQATNQMMDDENIDIDFMCNDQVIELKTSLIPDADFTIEQVIKKRDIKIIKREKNLDELKGDIHMQMYFGQRRKAKDEFLKNQDIDVINADIEELYEVLKLRAYLSHNYLVGWMDKGTLTERLLKQPADKRVWTFIGSKRQFWKCKIADSKVPELLIEKLHEAL